MLQLPIEGLGTKEAKTGTLILRPREKTIYVRAHETGYLAGVVDALATIVGALQAGGDIETATLKAEVACAQNVAMERAKHNRIEV